MTAAAIIIRMLAIFALSFVATVIVAVLALFLAYNPTPLPERPAIGPQSAGVGAGHAADTLPPTVEPLVPPEPTGPV
jgi:hypothetical protein